MRQMNAQFTPRLNSVLTVSSFTSLDCSLHGLCVLLMTIKQAHTSSACIKICHIFSVVMVFLGYFYYINHKYCKIIFPVST